MHHIVFRGNITRRCYLSYRVDLRRSGGAPGNCLDDGTGGLCSDQPVREKKLQTRKPDSVFKLSFIWDCNCLQPLAAYPPTFSFETRSGEQPSTVGIRGITACKVYPSLLLPAITVGSYPTFSPLSRLRRDGYFLWHCLFPPRAGPGCSPVHCSVLSGLSSGLKCSTAV